MKKMYWLWYTIIGFLLGFPIIFALGFILDPVATIDNIVSGKPLEVYRELLYPGVDVGPIFGIGVILISTIVGLIKGIKKQKRG